MDYDTATLIGPLVSDGAKKCCIEFVELSPRKILEIS